MKYRSNYIKNKFNISSDAFDLNTMVLTYYVKLFSYLKLDPEIIDNVVNMLSPNVFKFLSQKVLVLYEGANKRNMKRVRFKKRDLFSREEFGDAAWGIITNRVIENAENLILKIIIESIEMEIKIKENPKEAFDNELKYLKDLFNLSDESIDTLILLYCIDMDKYISDYFRDFNTIEIIHVASKLTNLERSILRYQISRQGPLVMQGLINDNGLRYSNLPELSDALNDYFSGMAVIDLQDRFVKVNSDPCFRQSSFQINKEKQDLIKGLLNSNRGSHILLYGRPGTGKTEFARSIIKAAGKKAYFLKLNEEEVKPNWHLALSVTEKRICNENAVLIVDEADYMLNNRPSFFFLINDNNQNNGKSWINNFMDGTNAKIIWIINHSSNLDDSTRRRFNYSLRFDDFNKRQRGIVWNNILKKSDLKKYIPRSLTERLASEFPINAGGVASAVESASEIIKDKEPVVEDIEALLRELLTRQLVLSGQNKESSLTLITKKYSADSLNLDTNRKALESSVKGFSDFLSNGASSVQRSMNILFWGSTGTGKTEYAKYLAGIIGRDIIVKRASDLLDMYVGNTEKHIREAFRQAEDSGSILFIDEADTFLMSRSKAERSWELSQVNELLTNMENYKGILICCTNLLEELDSACLRRFQWKVGFKVLDKEGRERLFKKYFQWIRFTKQIRRKLELLDGIVPGDFRAVEQRLGFLQKDTLTAELIIEELTKELKHRNKFTSDIGFNL